MNPSIINLPCTLGDRIRDTYTGTEGIAAGAKVRADGSTAVCIAWNSHGDPRYLWVSASRVAAGRTPEEIAAAEEAARAAAAAAVNAAGAVPARPLTEAEAYDAPVPPAPAAPAGETAAAPRSTRRRSAA